MSISISNITKRWGRVYGLEDVSLEVASGELVALLGPSGSGKTTLLRIIGGLETPDKGDIQFGGKDASGLSVRDRGVGFVFQHYALFRHLTVFENIAFGLRVLPKATRPPEAEIKRRVDRLLELVQLGGLARRQPAQLSGGQRQRVALARALAVEPRVLLLDEPFGALDAKVREDLRRWLRELHDELHVTSVFVTHDQEEALEVADRVVIMNRGRIEQIGTPTEIVDRPASAFVNEFVGEVSSLPGVISKGQALVGPLAVEAPGFAEGERVSVLVRSYEVELAPALIGNATVQRISPLGDRVKVTLLVDGGPLLHSQYHRDSPILTDLRPGGRVLSRISRGRVYGSSVETRASLSPEAGNSAAAE